MKESKHIDETIGALSKASVPIAASPAQPWVKPKFERIPLNDALTGPLAILQDGLLSGS